MKRLVMLLLLILCCTRIFAGPINKIVFFGDSLSDNGNLYKLLFKAIPKSPPYYQGRFSNGPTWAENVGNYFYDRQYIDYDIYAVGGATAIFHPPTDKFITLATLRLEIDQYLMNSLFKDKRNVLFVIWIGGNDYFFDRSTDVNAVINRISWAVTTLVKNGAGNFLILNLPDLSKVPKANNDSNAEKLHTLSVEHNQKLAAEVKMLQHQYPKVKINFIDIFSIFVDVMNDPQKYNKKYNINITNTTQGCWAGSNRFRNSLSNQSIKDEIQKTLSSQRHDISKINIQMMADYVANMPSVSEAYLVGKMQDYGITPCVNANEYLFWDEMHPTAIIHKILAQIAIEQMSNNFSG